MYAYIFWVDLFIALHLKNSCLISNETLRALCGSKEPPSLAFFGALVTVGHSSKWMQVEVFDADISMRPNWQKYVYIVVYCPR